ncbi:MAG: LPS assembly lipoprotein LptE [Pseudomonadota bacterium]
MSSPNVRRSAICLLAATLLISGCGFKPIAADDGPGALAKKPSINRLSVESEDPRFVYHLRRRISQSVNIGIVGAPNLRAATSISRTGLAISSDDSITRVTLRTATRYRLETSEKAEITAGIAQSTTSLNATTSQFATEISERDAVRRLADETADRLVNIIRLHSAD